MTKKSQLFVAPLCPECKKPMKPELLDVTNFNDPSSTYVFNWCCITEHEGTWLSIEEEKETTMTDWRKIAGDLYDELRVRGLQSASGDCIFRHSLSDSDTKDCLLAFELAEEQEAREKMEAEND